MRVFVVLLIVFLAKTSKAQNSSVAVHGTALSILGETTGGSRIGDDFGLGLNLRMAAPFFLRNLEINGEISYYQINIDYTQSGSEISFNHTKASQYNIGGGLTLYLFQKGKRPSMYHPYRFYISGYAGASAHTNEIVESHNINPRFTVFEGLSLFPYGDLLGGIKIRIDPRNSIDLFTGARMALSDAVDGIAGTGGAPDLMIRLGLGFCHSL
ncbi:MAG: hypothetical protein DA405_05790 [Bacteroidetes bacterium]|nr:MAG: hypothetical protein DA405_05790 [Bacteroidota bacterium]